MWGGDCNCLKLIDVGRPSQLWMATIPGAGHPELHKAGDIDLNISRQADRQAVGGQTDGWTDGRAGKPTCSYFSLPLIVDGMQSTALLLRLPANGGL